MTTLPKPPAIVAPPNVEGGSATSPSKSLSATLLGSVFREDRFFLVLSVFIGIFSGLAVVCFRFSIEWCRVHLL